MRLSSDSAPSRPPGPTLTGHLWTVLPKIRPVRFGADLPPARPWRLTVDDPRIGPVELTGSLHETAESGPREGGLVVLVHGLGGCADSHYMPGFVRRASEIGLACLRLNQRGADRRGEDFYHAGLTEDLDAALESPQLAGYEHLYLAGLSLGGHTVLRWAAVSRHPRVRAVAAVCSPLDLAASADAISRPGLGIYRRYLLGGLMDIYRAVAARRPVPLAVAEAARITSLREWDDRVVAPRHGFVDADDYYLRMSAGPVLGNLSVPALWAGSEADPMVPDAAVRPRLQTAPPGLEVRWTRRGGHLSFPGNLDLGLASAGREDLGLAGQILGWLLRAG